MNFKSKIPNSSSKQNALLTWNQNCSNDLHHIGTRCSRGDLAGTLSLLHPVCLILWASWSHSWQIPIPADNVNMGQWEKIIQSCDICWTNQERPCTLSAGIISICQNLLQVAPAEANPGNSNQSLSDPGWSGSGQTQGHDFVLPTTPPTPSCLLYRGAEILFLF